MFVGGGSAVSQYDINVTELKGLEGLGCESLDEGAIDAVFFHPFKVQVGYAWTHSAIDVSGTSVSVFERCYELIFIFIFIHFRPNIDRANTWLEFVGGGGKWFTPVEPSHTGAISRASEPALITTHDLSVKS
ncbi:hypothetical protein ES703_17157 [subsurface metagenome]